MTDNKIIKTLECCQSGIEKCNELKVFMEELNNNMNSIIDCYKQTKAETIKEFAKRLRQTVTTINEIYIDDLVKEIEKD